MSGQQWQAPYFVEKADLERDQAAIKDIWERNGLLNPSEAHSYFTWAFKNSPFGLGRCWLLTHTPSRTVVGTVGLLLRRMKIGESEQLVGRVAGLAIDRAHRSLGPALFLGKAITDELKESNLLAYTMAPPKASAVFMRLNYDCLGIAESHKKLLSVSDFFETRFPIFPKSANRLLKYIFDFSIWAMARETWNSLGTEKLVRIDQFDDRFDDLWRRAAPYYSFTTPRSSAFLRWRFTSNPRHSGYICDGLFSKDGILRGYSIYYTNMYTANLVDLITEGHGATMKELLFGLARRWRAEGLRTASIVTVGNERFNRRLRNLGFRNWNGLRRLGLGRSTTLGSLPGRLFISPMTSPHGVPIPVNLDCGFFIADDVD